MKVNRREAAALLIAGTLATRQRASADGGSKTFLHGVASGDPVADSVVLWTRIEPEDGAAAAPFTWQVASTPDFVDIVAEGRGETTAERDFTVKAVPRPLAPGRQYFFRFEARGEFSPVGRTRTLPRGKTPRLGIALASCSNYAFGYFNAYRAIAEDPAIDWVLHTGDYIYEYGALGWGAETARRLGRVHEPSREIVSLADYRERHAQYKRDPDSQAMHAAHPLLCCWDDHESTNNPWVGGAQNHQPSEGPWEERRDAAIQAYFEWMPIRDADSPAARRDFWRTYRFGDLATLITLETRHTARAEQIGYTEAARTIETVDDAERFKAEVVGAPGRRMLSDGMERDLRRGLRESVESGQPWRLLGNASPMARMLVPDLSSVLKPDSDGASLRPDLAWKAKFNMPFYTDTWDGYPWARERLYDLCRAAGAEDLVVLTGDSHSFWANHLRDERARAMGVELGTAGITSPGDFVESGYERETAAALDRAFEAGLDEVRWTDNLYQGYVRISLRAERADVDYVAVETVLERSPAAKVLRSERLERRAGTVTYAD